MDAAGGAKPAGDEDVAHPSAKAVAMKTTSVRSMAVLFTASLHHDVLVRRELAPPQDLAFQVYLRL